MKKPANKIDRTAVTIYAPAALRRALRLRAAEFDCSMSQAAIEILEKELLGMDSLRGYQHQKDGQADKTQPTIARES